MTEVEIRHGSATHVGQVREVNEDSMLAVTPVFVVADGMGGHDGGDVASSIVVSEFEQLGERDFDSETAVGVVEAALQACQRRITEYADAQQRDGKTGFQAGTTAVVALAVTSPDGPAWLLANLGDSRAYRVRAGVLEQLSVDHSVVQELVDTGMIEAAEAAHHPDRHIVTRALGGSDRPAADYSLLPWAEQDRLVLCSDGINEMLDDTEIARALTDPDPQVAAEQLVATAVVAGGRDNATVVVVDVMGLQAS